MRAADAEFQLQRYLVVPSNRDIHGVSILQANHAFEHQTTLLPEVDADNSSQAEQSSRDV